MGLFKKDKKEDTSTTNKEPQNTYQYINNIVSCRYDTLYSCSLYTPCLVHKINEKNFRFEEDYDSQRMYMYNYDYHNTLSDEEIKLLPSCNIKETGKDDIVSYEELRLIISKLIDIVKQLEWGISEEDVNNMEKEMNDKKENTYYSEYFKFNSYIPVYKRDIFEGLPTTDKEYNKPVFYIITDATKEQMSGWNFIDNKSNLTPYEPTDLIDFNIVFNDIDKFNANRFDIINKVMDYMQKSLSPKSVIRSELAKRFDIKA